MAALFALGLSPAFATPIGTGQTVTDTTLSGQNIDFDSTLTYVSTGTNAPYDTGAGLVNLTGNFTESLGTGANQVQWTGTGGFESTSTFPTVNIGGLSTPETLTWGQGGFVPDGSALVLSAVRFENGINLGTDPNATRQIGVGAEAMFSGSITGSGNLLLQAYGQQSLYPTVFNNGNNGIVMINISGGLTFNHVDGIIGGIVTASGLNLNESIFQMDFQGTAAVTMSGGSRWDLFAEDGTNNLNQTLSSLNSTDSSSLIDMAGYAGFLVSPGPSSVHLTVDSGYYAGRLLEDNNQSTSPGGPTPGFGASLIKDGPGILTLANDNSTTENIGGSTYYYGYSQGTTVKQGTLLVTNTSGSATGTGAVTVMSGGSLGGSGIIAPTGTSTVSISDGTGPATPHDLVVRSGGKIDLDAFDPTQTPTAMINTLTIALHATDAATLEAGAGLVFDLGPGGTSDKLAFKGLTSGTSQVFFNDNAVTLDFLPGAADGTYTLFTFDQTNAYAGTLQNGTDYTFSYNPTSITVTIVPEPSAMSLILSGFMVLTLARLKAVRATRQYKNGTKIA